MTSVRRSTRCRFVRSHSKSAERVITFHVSRETYILRLFGMPCSAHLLHHRYISRLG
jgi:hypothetical protein